MIIKEELDFINESEIFFKKRFSIDKKNIVDAYEAVQQVKRWLETTIYSDYFDDVIIEITDTPILGELAFFGVDTNSKEVFVHLNLMVLVYEFEDENYKKDFLFEESVTCFEFASFVLLHEFGHVIHAMLECPGENKYESLHSYKAKYLSLYQSLERLEKGRKRSKLYRKIPSEKFADSYGMQNYKNIEKQ